MKQVCDRSRVPAFAYDGFGYRIYSNRAFDELVGYEGRSFLGTRPPYPYWGQEASNAGMLEQVLSGRLEALGVRALSMYFTHASDRRFLVLLTGKIVHEEDQVLAFLNFAIKEEYAQRLPWDLFKPPRIQVADIEPLVTAVERRLFGVLDLSPLTAREREILEHVRAAQRPATIAKLLHVSTHTVRNHIKAAKRKLGIHSAVELVAALGDEGVVAERPPPVSHPLVREEKR